MKMSASLQIRLRDQKIVIHDVDAQKNRFFCAPTHHILTLIDTITCMLVYKEANP